jgi:hypothetical protein
MILAETRWLILYIRPIPTPMNGCTRAVVSNVELAHDNSSVSTRAVGKGGFVVGLGGVIYGDTPPCTKNGMVSCMSNNQFL